MYLKKSQVLMNTYALAAAAAAPHPRSRALNAVGKALAESAQALAEWRARRDERQAMNALLDAPEYLLHDIGLLRHEVLQRTLYEEPRRTSPRTANRPAPERTSDVRSNQHHGPVRRLLGLLLAALAALSENTQRRRDMRRLQEMPDYLLKDIGLTRAEVIGGRRKS